MTEDICCVCLGPKRCDPLWYHGENDLAWVYVFKCGHSVHVACAQPRECYSPTLAKCPLCCQPINWADAVVDRVSDFDESYVDQTSNFDESYVDTPPVQYFIDPVSGHYWWWIDDGKGDDNYGSCGWC